MVTAIRYNLSISSSGPFRPLGAQSGAYLHCPPQRWLNNLKHGATVFLYHPCAPVRQRVRLSVLTCSCLSDYIMTLYPDLSTHWPLAIVSWGRTLELSTVTSSDICDWLEGATAAQGNRGDVGKTRKYDLLLIHPAGRHTHREGPHLHLPNAPKESVRRCCERGLAEFHVETPEEETEQRKERSAERNQTVARVTPSLLDLDPLTEPGTLDLHPGPLALGLPLQPKPEVNHQNTPPPQTATQSKSSTCAAGGCSGLEASSPLGGSVLANGMPRTPRTDEAVWAAAALGFLLVLLALSVLHTRLYRHWRTSPSLYWYDRRQDYDSVGDVIRRRLKIAERRRKRRPSFNRRHECSLLPNSSTDEDQ
ncbi:tumor protein p53-inducible protein 13 [Aplochiton taeniatus]